MSTTESEPGVRQATAVDAPAARRWRSSRRARALSVAAVLVLAAIVVVVLDPFAGGSTPATGVQDNSYPTGRAAVRQGALSSQVTGVGTLGYSALPNGSPYKIVNQAGGHLTAVPTIGQVIVQGQVLYRVDDHPVVLLDGSTPAYRSLSEGDTGRDVRELNGDLVALGLASRIQISP